MKKAVLCTISFCLAGCGVTQSTSLLDQSPIERASMKGDYRALATCGFNLFERKGVINKIDLPEQRQSKLSHVGGTIKAWELTFTEAGPGQTTVDLSSVQTIWGPDRLTTSTLLRELQQSCASA